MVCYNFINQNNLTIPSIFFFSNIFDINNTIGKKGTTKSNIIIKYHNTRETTRENDAPGDYLEKARRVAASILTPY